MSASQASRKARADSHNPKVVDPVCATWHTPGMLKRRGNPTMTVRLRPQTLRQLTRLAKAFDYRDRSAFVREFIETAVSGDMNLLGDFLGRMMRKAAEAHQASLPGFLSDQDEKRGGRRARAS